MKFNLSVLLAVFILLHFSASSEELKYSRARIWFESKSPAELATIGIDLSEGEYKKGSWFISDFSDVELVKINQVGFRVEILIDDVQSFYRNRNNNPSKNSSSVNYCNAISPDYPVPNHFYLGSMGGFYTYNQYLGIIDSMALLFPTLISAKQSIDPILSIEGRPIYYLKISDNPGVDENEPEVLYDAVHHAREPGSMSALIYYMWYLLENYSTDSTIRALVDNTEMYFIPCINPDGYIYNEQTDPFGGGMWRKNRRDNLDGEFGVDLNRNYGFQWGFDTIGSSMNTFSGTYRGTAPFSEPETQAVRNFMNSRQFKLNFNYHTYGDHNIIPWGYIPNLLTPDSTLYNFYGEAVTRFNNYTVGTTNQTLNYLVNGVADDWMYGEQTSKPKSFSMTPEIGQSSDGFWPAANRIIPLCKENVYANLTLAKLAGKYGTIQHQEERYLDQLTNQVNFTFQELGLDTTGTFTISIVPITSNILSTGPPIQLSGFSFMQTVSDSISITLNPSINRAEEIKYALLLNNGLYVYSDTISQLYGTPVNLFYDDGSTISNWNSFPSSTWGNTDEKFVSAPYSITDSPYNIYQPFTNDPLTLTNPISLTGLIDARLTFYTQWELEGQYDYVQVLASPDNGLSWTPLCGKYTIPGFPTQASGEPLFDEKEFNWVQEEMSLNNFLGQDIILRFVIVSDNGQEYDGFYFDDITVVTLPDNTSINNVYSPFIKIYPNPALENVNITYQNVMTGSNLICYDVFGRTVLTIPISEQSGKTTFSTESLSPGIYFFGIQFADKKVSSITKLVINK